MFDSICSNAGVVRVCACVCVLMLLWLAISCCFVLLGAGGLASLPVKFCEVQTPNIQNIMS